VANAGGTGIKAALEVARYVTAVEAVVERAYGDDRVREQRGAVEVG
jgi:hypothetical protein